MRPLLAAVFFTALLAPAAAAPTNAVTGNAAFAADRPTVLALNPQPEPPGRAKIKRIYPGKDDSLRNKLKPKPVKAPATKY